MEFDRTMEVITIVPSHMKFCQLECKCPKHERKQYKPLSILILDCWQREYDRRPYENFILHGKIFNHKMQRRPNIRDFKILVEFLETRKLKAVELAYFTLPICILPPFWYERLANALKRVTVVCLTNIDVPVALLKELNVIVHECVIRLLRLNGNSLTYKHTEYLRCFIIRSKSLQYLDVGFCDLTEHSFAMVADGVQKSNSVRGIDMSRVVLQSRVSSLEENKIGTIIAQLIWKHQLVEIHFKHCNLDCTAIIPIAEYIGTSRTLMYVDLGSNIIEGDGAGHLLKAAQKLKKLIGLDLSNNRFGGYGGQIVAHELPFTNIRYLDIARNGIPSPEIYLILSTIDKCPQMRIMNIVGNLYDADCGAALKRQLSNRVLIMDTVDSAVTYDEYTEKFRIVARDNDGSKYNERYHRVAYAYQWPKCFFICKYENF